MDAGLKCDDAWYIMLTQVAGLREHATFFQAQDLAARAPMSHPFIDMQGPGIMYVKMVALLDEAFESVTNQKVLVPRRHDLNGRINCLSEAGLLLNAPEMHRVRKRRNDVAHNPAAVSTWADLETDIAIVHVELEHLGLVQDLPKLRTVFERTPDMTPRPGIAMVHNYLFGVMTDRDVLVFEYRWSRAFYRVGWDANRVEEALALGERVPLGIEDA